MRRVRPSQAGLPWGVGEGEVLAAAGGLGSPSPILATPPLPSRSKESKVNFVGEVGDGNPSILCSCDKRQTSIWKATVVCACLSYPHSLETQRRKLALILACVPRAGRY